jgi:GDP-mannose transporter
MIGALNKLPIAIFGMLYFHAVVNVASISSILIAFGGGLLYSWAKSQVHYTLPLYRVNKAT